jgi:hypothetical protein
LRDSQFFFFFETEILWGPENKGHSWLRESWIPATKSGWKMATEMDEKRERVRHTPAVKFKQ